MDIARRRRAAEIFADVLELPSGARARRLEDACAGDPELLAEVVSLLEALPAAERYFQSARCSSERREVSRQEDGHRSSTNGGHGHSSA